MNKINPTLVKKAANFTVAAVKHIADGFERLPEQQYLVRLSICKGTDDKSPCDAFNPETFICRDWRCGCSLIKKAYWRSEDCPRKLWPGLNENEILSTGE